MLFLKKLMKISYILYIWYNFDYTTIRKNPHISSKKTVVQRLFFTENRTNYLLLSLPVSHSAARVTTNKTEPYARKLKSPLNSSNIIFSILKSVFFSC